jgi:hypothetical protein
MDNLLDQASAFTQMWTDMIGKMWGVGTAWQPSTPPPDAFRQMRSGMLQAMSQSLDGFMRSPAMLEWMKQSMDATVAFRKQMNEMFSQFHEQTQNASSRDIDNLMRGMRHLEQRILDRLDETQEQLEVISQRLDALEEGEEVSEHSNGGTNGQSRLARRRFARNRGRAGTAGRSSVSKDPESGAADE